MKLSECLSKPQLAARAVYAISELLRKLREISERLQTSADDVKGRARLGIWKTRAIEVLKSVNGHQEADRLVEETTRPKQRTISPMLDVLKEMEIYAAYLEALKEDIEEHPKTAFENVPDRLEADSAGPVNPRSVFLIHGRDETNLLKLRDLIVNQWGLEPKVLQEEPWKRLSP